MLLILTVTSGCVFLNSTAAAFHQLTSVLEVGPLYCPVITSVCFPPLLLPDDPLQADAASAAARAIPVRPIVVRLRLAVRKVFILEPLTFAGSVGGLAGG